MVKLPAKDPIPVNEVARALDKHVSTLYRWASPRGVRGHRLRLFRLGGRTCIYRRDLEQFFQSLNGEQRTPTNPHLGADRQIDNELDAAGL